MWPQDIISQANLILFEVSLHIKIQEKTLNGFMVNKDRLYVQIPSKSDDIIKDMHSIFLPGWR